MLLVKHGLVWFYPGKISWLSSSPRSVGLEMSALYLQFWGNLDIVFFFSPNGIFTTGCFILLQYSFSDLQGGFVFICWHKSHFVMDTDDVVI